MPSIRYTRNAAKNRILKAMLIKEWGSQCYWCKSPRAFNDLAIDHIVAKKLPLGRIKFYQDAGELPSDFDFDAPSNLAPICTPCNTEKSDSDVLQSYKIEGALGRAAKYAPMVAKRALAWDPHNKLGEALLQATEADMRQPGVKDLYDELGPLLLPKLAYMMQRDDYIELVKVYLSQGTQGVRASAELDLIGRDTRSVLKELSGVEMDDALEQATYRLLDDVVKHVTNGFEGKEMPSGQYLSVGDGQPDRVFVSITRVRFELADDQIFFQLSGELDGTFTASLSVNSSDGAGTDYLQGDALVICKFDVSTSLLLAGDEQVDDVPWLVSLTELDITPDIF